MLISNQASASSVLELLINRTPEEIQNYIEAVDQILDELNIATLDEDGDYVIDLASASLVASVLFQSSEDRLGDLIHQMRRSPDFTDDFKSIERIDITMRVPTSVIPNMTMIEMSNEVSFTRSTVDVIEKSSSKGQRISVTLEQIFQNDIPEKYRRIFSPIRTALIIEFQDAYLERFLSTLDNMAKARNMSSFLRDIYNLKDKPYFSLYYNDLDSSYLLRMHAMDIQIRNMNEGIREIVDRRYGSYTTMMPMPEFLIQTTYLESVLGKETLNKLLTKGPNGMLIGLGLGGVAWLYHFMEEPVEASAIEEEQDSDHIAIYGVFTPKEMLAYKEHFQSIRDVLSNHLEHRTRPPSDIGFGL